MLFDEDQDTHREEDDTDDIHVESLLEDCNILLNENLEGRARDSIPEKVPGLDPPTPFLHKTVLGEGEFVLIKFQPKEKFVFYAGKVVKKYGDDDYDVQCLRHKHKYFIFPNVPDISSVSSRDTMSKLPTPIEKGRGRLVFPVNLDNFNVR